MTGWLVALALAEALDAGSSCLAIRRGGVEVGPLMPHTCAAITGVKAATTVGLAAGVRMFGHSHPKAARWLAAGLTGGLVAIAAHNLRVGHP